MDLADAAASVDGARRGCPRREVARRVWEVAVGLARCCGSGRTARALGLNARELELRLDRRRGRAAAAGLPAFVEIVPRPQAANGACVLRIDGADGRTVRLQLAVADAALLERVLVATAKAPP